MSFTQALCGDCWIREQDAQYLQETEAGISDALRTAPRWPHIVRGTPEEPNDEEMCCVCGKTTTLGLFVRRDPKEVAFPRTDD